MTTVNIKTKHLTDDFVSFAAKLAIEKERKGFCLKGEDDFERVMELSKNEAVLKWTWLVWREKVGPPMTEPYRRLIDIENAGARRNGKVKIHVAGLLKFSSANHKAETAVWDDLTPDRPMRS